MSLMTMDTKTAVERFVIAEARLLDDGRYSDWLDLFADDGFYWVPAARDQTDPINHLSILYEDKSVLGMRIRRLEHPRVYSANPMPRTARLVGSFDVEEEADGTAVCRSTVMMAEYRAGDRKLLAGHQTHRLRRTADGWKIVLKRVDLIDCDAVHGIMSVPI